MKEKAVEVKTGGKVVATVTVPQYEKLEEVISNLKEEKIVSFVNRMLVTDKTNEERAKHRPSTAGKQRRRTIAMQVAFDNEATKAKFIELIQGKDPDALTAFLDSEEVQALVDEELTAGA